MLHGSYQGVEANEKNKEPRSHFLNICAKMANNLSICTYCAWFKFQIVPTDNAAITYSINTSLKVQINKILQRFPLKTFKQ